MQSETFAVNNFTELKAQLLIWANRFSSCSFLDNHQYASEYNMQECLVAAGVQEAFNLLPGSDIHSLQHFISANKGRWMFGHLSYDLKNAINDTHPPPADLSGFSSAYFFVPQVIVRLNNRHITISSDTFSPTQTWEDITATKITGTKSYREIRLQPTISRQQYLEKINLLKKHIHRGDCYEVNFCQEFFSPGIEIDPVHLYSNLSSESPNPFSCYYKNDNAHLLCASPERFLSKKGSRLFSQPIKGTTARDRNNPKADAQNLQQLRESLKDRSENVMVVDLVRNDLSKICLEGSVRVDELFGIYSYPQVHQMISTISGELKKDVSFTEILEATFPMGSMTGAPKKRVMELIEQYEQRNRGIFSGAVGYISQEGDFDFNVVIRSLLYNQSTGYLSYWVGSGITWYSHAEEEYEECLLKAGAIKKVLQSAALF